MTGAERRAKIREGLSTLYQPGYDRLCALLPPEWAPYMGLRDFATQDRLWRMGRQSPGKIVTNAKGGESPHQYGCATDWCLWDPQNRPYWPKAEDPRWQIYVEAVKAVGLRPGAEFGDTDHNELKIECSWPHVLVAFKQYGSLTAQQYIEERLAKA